jgi:transposase
VSEYRIVTRACAACGATATATTPTCPPARVQYGPTVLARAAELVCAHDLPVVRATRLMRSMVGVPVSVGFMASVRGRAARMLEQTFLPRVRHLLRQAGMPHVDETPARAAGGLEYVHLAATEYLTALHTGGAARPTSTPDRSCPGMPARSSATATPATPT